MLAAEHVWVAFRRYEGVVHQTLMRCLTDVSVSVARGEVLAVVGASGAGKSLLANAILGILPANCEHGGTLLFDGQPLTPDRQNSLRGRRIALVPQSITHLDPMVRTGRQVAWAARRARVAPDKARTACAASLSRFGLPEDVRSHFPHTLSGGMARRILLAIATVGDADLIVADEATNGLDSENLELVTGHLRVLADAGKAVMLITHDLPAALTVADRVSLLRDGVTDGVMPAGDFSGDGARLATPYARALWKALPQNDFFVA